MRGSAIFVFGDFRRVDKPASAILIIFPKRKLALPLSLFFIYGIIYVRFSP